MGVLSDLVVAAEGDAERVASSQAPAQDFGGIDIKGIDPVKLETLRAILAGQPSEDLLSAYDPVVTVSDDGPWVFRIPSDLVTRLATLAGEEKQAVVTQWANSEELALEGWGATEVAQVFEGISSLARTAEETGKSLFLWMSL